MGTSNPEVDPQCKAASFRRLDAPTSFFQLIHGLVDRIMEVLGTPFVSPGDKTGYYIESSNEPEYLKGRQAHIIFKGDKIGTFGIVHPQVLHNFDIPDPCSFVEIDIEKFL